jgi:type IV pilus assembly protein PilP
MPKIRLRNKWAIVVGLFITVPLFVAGCSKKEQPVTKPAPAPTKPPIVATPVQKQRTSAVAVVSSPAQLEFTNRKDPFKPFIVQQQAAQKSLERKPRSSDSLPIQSYDVTKFKVSGIIAGLKENKALVIDPAGKGYVVKQGMLIGNNDGYISKITSSSIEVVESYREDNGRLRKRSIMLTLPLKGKETSR